MALLGGVDLARAVLKAKDRYDLLSLGSATPIRVADDGFLSNLRRTATAVAFLQALLALGTQHSTSASLPSLLGAFPIQICPTFLPGSALNGALTATRCTTLIRPLRTQTTWITRSASPAATTHPRESTGTAT